MSAIADTVRRMLHPLAVRIANAIARGVVRVVDDQGNLQRLQVSALRGETLERVERFQDWGITSHPPADGTAEAALVFVGGNRDHPIAVGVVHRPSKPDAQDEGTVMLYNLVDGTSIRLMPDGSIRIESATSVVVDCPDVTITGDATIGGVSFADLVAAYNTHTHIDSEGGTTSPPTPTV